MKTLEQLGREATRFANMSDVAVASRFAGHLEDRERPLAEDEYRLLTEAIELVVRRAFIAGADAAREGVR